MLLSFTLRKKQYNKKKNTRSVFFFLYKENHALDAWFKIAYGEEEEILLG